MAHTRQAGWYFVDWYRIAYWNGANWLLSGIQDRYMAHTFTPISDTPITPEKMAAIDEVIALCNSDTINELYAPMVAQILTKHKLI